jgi:hypothetical protein
MRRVPILVAVVPMPEDRFLAATSREFESWGMKIESHVVGRSGARVVCEQGFPVSSGAPEPPRRACSVRNSGRMASGKLRTGHFRVFATISAKSPQYA